MYRAQVWIVFVVVVVGGTEVLFMPYCLRWTYKDFVANQKERNMLKPKITRLGPFCENFDLYYPVKYNINLFNLIISTKEVINEIFTRKLWCKNENYAFWPDYCIFQAMERQSLLSHISKIKYVCTEIPDTK